MKRLFLIVILTVSISNLKSQTNDTLLIQEKSAPSQNQKDPLFIFDNTVIKRDILTDIDPMLIQEIEVIKNKDTCEKFVEAYGEDARNGVIIIKTKKYLAIQWITIFNRFCKSDRLDRLLAKPDFDYEKFSIYLNGIKLKTDFFDKLELKEIDILNVQFKKVLFKKDRFKIKVRSK